MVIWQILHAGHSKCMYNFTCPCSYLGVSYFDVEKNYFTWDTFRCIYFSAWLLFSSTFNLQKVETVAREPRLDSFPKVHGFSMPIETLLKTHAHARLRHLLFYVFKKSGNSRKKMCWIPRKDLMTYHPRCVEFQEKISWRTIPDVLNSKKRSHDVPSQMCWIPRKDLMTYHPRCVEFQEKISWRTLPDVLNSKKRSHDVPSQMCWIPRKDLMTYHPRCVEFQEKVSCRTIPDVFKSKERYYTPPTPPPTPTPPTNTTPKKQQKKTKQRGFNWGETKKTRKKCALTVAPVQWTSKNTVSWRGLLRAPSHLLTYLLIYLSL